MSHSPFVWRHSFQYFLFLPKQESPRLKHVLSLKRHLVHRCESILKEECDSIVNIVKRLALSFETVDWNQDYELLAEAPPSSQAELRILVRLALMRNDCNFGLPTFFL